MPPELCKAYTNQWVQNDGERRNQDSLLDDWQQRIIPGLGRPVYTYQAQWNPDATTPELALPLQCPGTDPVNIKRWQNQWGSVDVRVDGLDVRDHGYEAEKAIAYNKVLTKGRLTDFSVNGEELGEIVLGELISSIEMRFPHHKEMEYIDDLQRELDQQDQFVFRNTEGFIKRKGDFDSLDAYSKTGSSKTGSGFHSLPLKGCR